MKRIHANISCFCYVYTVPLQLCSSVSSIKGIDLEKKLFSFKFQSLVMAAILL